MAAEIVDRLWPGEKPFTVDRHELIATLRTAVQDVYVDAAIRRWTIRLVRATRELEGVAIGASVRGSLALERAAGAPPEARSGACLGRGSAGQGGHIGAAASTLTGRREGQE